MWRRASNQLHQTLIRCRSHPKPHQSISRVPRSSISTDSGTARSAGAGFGSGGGKIGEEVLKSLKKVEDVMPIATGHEREELEGLIQGRDLLEINHPVGPFGTKEEPAIVKSYFHKRIVGCPGGEGEDEHDVVWFWLEKGKPHECPVCTQYFKSLGMTKMKSSKRQHTKIQKLEVVGPGGPPDGHGDDHH